MFGARMSETMSETNGNKLLFCRDSEAAFGSESATRGGSFWTRIRLGKAVAGSGVRGLDWGKLELDERDGNKLLFCRDSEAAFGVAGSGVRGEFGSESTL